MRQQAVQPNVKAGQYANHSPASRRRRSKLYSSTQYEPGMPRLNSIRQGSISIRLQLTIVSPEADEVREPGSQGEKLLLVQPGRTEQFVEDNIGPDVLYDRIHCAHTMATAETQDSSSKRRKKKIA